MSCAKLIFKETLLLKLFLFSIPSEFFLFCFSFNQLCLPEYENYEQFEKALRIAINEGAEGFGLF